MNVGGMRRSRRGFTMLELLVVISILIIAVLVFATFLGPSSIGPALERNARGIRTMVANVRQNSSTRKVHSELVIDYKHDRVVALARRRLATFAFDGDSPTLGSGNVIGDLQGGATTTADRTLQLVDGGALELPDTQASFSIPWMPAFDVAGDYEGMAVAFDYYPIPGGGSTLVSMGSLYTIQVAHGPRGAVMLSLVSGGATVTARSYLAPYRWATVEIAVSRYGVTLYVDGRVNEAALPPDGFSVPQASGTVTRIGGVSCRIDNFEMFSLVSSQVMQLTDVQLVPEFVDPALEIAGAAEDIYRWEPEPPANGPITGGNAPAEPPPDPSLPSGVPAIRHVHFDTAGKLDPVRHTGAVFIHMVALVDGELRRMVVTIHPLGTVTWDYVDRFAWEAAPAPGTEDTP
jgi:prepilin-type N-terminal cleavage/methylation domain-containing protein